MAKLVVNDKSFAGLDREAAEKMAAEKIFNEG